MSHLIVKPGLETLQFHEHNSGTLLDWAGLSPQSLGLEFDTGRVYCVLPGDRTICRVEQVIFPSDWLLKGADNRLCAVSNDGFHFMFHIQSGTYDQLGPAPLPAPSPRSLELAIRRAAELSQILQTIAAARTEEDSPHPSYQRPQRRIELPVTETEEPPTQGSPDAHDHTAQVQRPALPLQTGGGLSSDSLLVALFPALARHAQHGAADRDG